MIATELHIPLIEGLGDDIVIVGRRFQCVVQEGLHLQCATHAAQFEVAQKQLSQGEAGADASLLQVGGGLTSQRAYR